MNSNLNKKLDLVSTKPGVYMMKDEKGDVIYVGKANNLKKRVLSYFIKSDTKKIHTDIKTWALVKKIESFETIITGTENEALLLESTLIKRYKPRYNIILKDDKKYPFLQIDVKSRYPKVSIVRKITDNDSLYFGPFSSSSAVRNTLKIINRTFKLRKCQTKNFSSRSRPCINYQMGTCLGPCCLEIDNGLYGEIVKEVILFLKGRTPRLIKQIKTKMLNAAKLKNFEIAAEQRDKLFALEKILEKQIAVTTDFIDRDVIALARNPEFSFITLMIVRGGYLHGMRHFNINSSMSNASETIGSFIKQYYTKKDFIPGEILVPLIFEDKTLLEDRLSSLKNRRVKIIRPLKGEKTRLVQMAFKNAENRLKEKIESDAAGLKMLTLLGKRLNMKKIPEHIECFDNSNISGVEPVAGMVVFINGRPDKSKYRKYIIKSVDVQNDYAYMAEILKRRFSRGEKSKPFPDLVIVDGGKGQLNIDVSVINELNLDEKFQIIGIAKKDREKGEYEDKIYMPGRLNPVNFSSVKSGTGLLLFLQRIRDEAHNFAISFHRKRRKTSAMQSALDGISGIGKKRKTVLLKHFGSVDRIKSASIEEIISLKGMNKTAAESLKTALI